HGVDQRAVVEPPGDDGRSAITTLEHPRGGVEPQARFLSEGAVASDATPGQDWFHVANVVDVAARGGEWNRQSGDRCDPRCAFDRAPHHTSAVPRPPLTAPPGRSNFFWIVKRPPRPRQARAPRSAAVLTTTGRSTRGGWLAPAPTALRANSPRG